MKFTEKPGTTIIIFLALVSVFYLVGFWLIFRLASATPLMLSVGLAAIVTCLLTNRKLDTLGWRWPGWKHQWSNYLIPLGYSLLAYSFIWIANFGDWYNLEFLLEKKDSYNLGSWTNFSVVIFHFTITATISFILLLPSVLGEELGWRGLLVPALSKTFSFGGVALISGFLWAAWHWPLMLKGLYGNDITPLPYQLILFTIGLMSMSVIMTYFRLKTNSLWPAVILHMSHNVFLQKFFTPMTAEVPSSVWFIDEFGAILPITIFIFAIYFWRKGQNEFRVANT